MRMRLSLFSKVYRQTHGLRKKLIAAGRFTETHFEIDDEALKAITMERLPRIVGQAQTRPAVGVPCGHGVKSGQAPKELPEPTLAQMTENFGQAMATFIKAGLPVASKEVVLERAAACRKPCDYWDEKARLGLGKCRHPACGCSKGKWWLGTSRCPLGLWPR